MAVAYAHIGTNFSKNSADNWVDTQVFLPVIQSVVAQYFGELADGIESIILKTEWSTLRIELESEEEIEIGRDFLDYLNKIINIYHPSLTVEVKNRRINNSWERINSGAINSNNTTLSEEIGMAKESDFRSKIKNIAIKLDEAKPEDKIKKIQEQQKQLPDLILNAGDYINGQFGDRIKVTWSDTRAIRDANTERTSYVKSVDVSMSLVPNKMLRLQIKVTPMNGTATKVALMVSRNRNFSSFSVVKEYNLQTFKDFNALHKTLSQDAEEILCLEFISTFEDELMKYSD